MYLIKYKIRTPWGVTLKPVPRKSVEHSEQSEQDLIALQRGKLGKIKRRNVPEPEVIKILHLKQQILCRLKS